MAIWKEGFDDDGITISRLINAQIFTKASYVHILIDLFCGTESDEHLVIRDPRAPFLE